MLPKQLKYSTLSTVFDLPQSVLRRLFWDSHCLTFFHIHFHLTAPSNSSYNSQFCKLALPYYTILHLMYVPLCAYSIYMTKFRQATPYVPTDICCIQYNISLYVRLTVRIKLGEFCVPSNRTCGQIPVQRSNCTNFRYSALTVSKPLPSTSCSIH
jgi:hypothetical protein